MIITGSYPNLRLRRSRKFGWSRRLVQENNLSYNDLILPIFITEGKNKKIPVKYYKHPAGKVYIDDRMLNLFLPLMKAQKFIHKCEKYNGQDRLIYRHLRPQMH